MSSINKSGTRFAPKLTQRNRKVPGARPSAASSSGIVTPSSTQAVESTQDIINQTTGEPLNLDTSITPPATQSQANIEAGQPNKDVMQRESQSVAASELAIDESDDENDNDPTKTINNSRSGSVTVANKPNESTFLAPSRRSSVASTSSSVRRQSISTVRRESGVSAQSRPIFKPNFLSGPMASSSAVGPASTDSTSSQRRLSSLSAGLKPNFKRTSRRGSSVINTLPPIFNKSSSVSGSSAAIIDDSNEDEANPVKITIPLSNDRRRRRSTMKSTVGGSSKKLLDMKRRLSEDIEPLNNIEVGSKKQKSEQSSVSNSVAETSASTSIPSINEQNRETKEGDGQSDENNEANEVNSREQGSSEDSVTGKSLLRNDSTKGSPTDKQTEKAISETSDSYNRSLLLSNKKLLSGIVHGDDDEEEDQPELDRSSRRKGKSIVEEKSENARSEKTKSAQSTSSANKAETTTEPEKMITQDLTEEEIKAGSKYYINPLTRKLKKATLQEFDKQKSNIPDPNIINNLDSLKGLRVNEDAELLAKFHINEETVTLEELCRPSVPIGAISTNFSRAVTGDKERRKQLIERRRLRMEAREKRISLEELEKQEEEKKRLEREELRNKIKNGDANLLDKKPESQAAAPVLFKRRNVPQLTVGSSGGGIQLNQESTTLDRHNMNNGDGYDDRERVVENPFENPVNSSTYGKKKYTDKWTTEELKELYQALSSWGTDFGLISQLFPYRTRRQIKAKFNLEEKRNPHLVELALLRKLPVNFEEYCDRTGKDFKTLEEYNDELRLLKVKHDKEVRDMKANREKARLEDLNRQNNPVNLNPSGRYRNRKLQISEFRKNEVVVGSIDDMKRSE